MSNSMLRLEHLSKTFRSQWLYRPIEALKDMNLDIAKGEAFGFLGHNGAGKTTAIKCIMGLINITSGKVYLEDRELVSAEQHREVSYLPELPYFYDHLSVKETLAFFASLHDIKNPERTKRVNEVLEKVGLSNRSNNRVRSLSKGLQQRLGIAQAIINRPRLLILDEPFSGLDPIGRLEIREIILELKNLGTTIFLSSHILSDVEDICDRVSIMSHGVLQQVFKLSDMPSLFGEEYLLIVEELPSDSEIYRSLATNSKKVDTVIHANSAATSFHVKDYDTASLALVLAQKANVKILEFRLMRPRLEDIFMQITGQRYTSNYSSPEKAKGTR